MDRKQIEGVVLEFFAMIGGQQFHMTALTGFCCDYISGHLAPDTPGRIMRKLRQERRINYRVVSRDKSLYQQVFA